MLAVGTLLPVSATVVIALVVTALRRPIPSTAVASTPCQSIFIHPCKYTVKPLKRFIFASFCVTAIVLKHVALHAQILFFEDHSHTSPKLIMCLHEIVI